MAGLREQLAEAERERDVLRRRLEAATDRDGTLKKSVRPSPTLLLSGPTTDNPNTDFVLLIVTNCHNFFNMCPI